MLPLDGNSKAWDHIRGRNPKKITYHIVPYFIHAYSFAIPGISTGKLHARGPVGADQLTTFKYVVKGQGQLRS